MVLLMDLAMMSWNMDTATDPHAMTGTFAAMTKPLKTTGQPTKIMPTNIKKTNQTDLSMKLLSQHDIHPNVNKKSTEC